MATKDPSKAVLEKKKLEAEIAQLEMSSRSSAIDLELKELDYRQKLENFRTRMYAQRTFHFNDVIFGDSVAFCMNRIQDYVDLDPNAPITIVLNSPGGSVMDGFQLYDFILDIRSRGVRIDTVVMGMGASMAGVVAQAGESRIIGPNAYFMVHEVASMSLGKLSSMKDAVKFSERLYDRLLGILASRSKLSVEEIRQRADRKDWWLCASEAFEHGFIDRILSVPIGQVA